MIVRHEVCPKCAFVYLHADGEGCPRCEREALRIQLAAMEKENERLTREVDDYKASVANLARALQEILIRATAAEKALGEVREALAEGITREEQWEKDDRVRRSRYERHFLAEQALCDIWNTLRSALASHSDAAEGGTKGATLDDVRPEVAAFAHAMEAKLRENEHKGGWKGCQLEYLVGRLTMECQELWGSLTPQSDEARANTLREAADVANFAMMIADVCGALLPKEKP